jgi:predicted regulator of amino acid metabolism with ACT domain
VGAADANGVLKDPVVAEAGALASLARYIAKQGINLRSIGGRGIETGGVLTLCVGDKEGDAKLLEDVLTAKGLRWEVYVPESADLEDHPGALAEFAQRIADSGRLIQTIVVGTPHGKSDGTPGSGHVGEPHVPGTIPVQATTIAVRGL